MRKHSNLTQSRDIPSNITFSKYVELHEDEVLCKSDHLGKGKLTLIINRLDFPIKDVLPMHIMEVISILESEVAQSTVNKYIRFMKKTFCLAEKEGLIYDNPMKNIDTKYERYNIQNTKMTENQRKEMMVLIEASKMRLFLHFVSIMGLPMNVTRAIFWDDIDFSNDILNIRYIAMDGVKNPNDRSLASIEKQRHLHIPVFIMKELLEEYDKQLITMRKNGINVSIHRPIFVTNSGNLYSFALIDREVKNIGYAIGINNLTCGDICKDSVYQAILMGVPLVDIMNYYNIGNKNRMIIQMYKEARSQSAIK